jgi:hypothetical protein
MPAIRTVFPVNAVSDGAQSIPEALNDLMKRLKRVAEAVDKTV